MDKICSQLWHYLSLFNAFNITFIILVTYFGLVYFYLKHLTHKYLTPIDRTEILSRNIRRLKTNHEIREQYADKDTINILVLTGGGVRGLIPLKILEQLEKLTGKKTGELFDFMAGTSTGAINCGILALAENNKYSYSASDIARDYLQNCRKMFSAPWYHKFLTFFGLFGPRYLPEGKLEVLHSYFKDHTLADIDMNFLVPVYDLEANSLKVVRNWEPTIQDNYTNYLLRDLIHGASNPPMLFSPRAFLIGERKSIFIDPGVILNNPAEIALLNAWFMFPNRKLRLVLIGNGGNDAEHYGYDHMAAFGVYGLFQYLLNSPVISTKFSTDLVQEYIHEARDYGLDVDFVYINSKGGAELATGNISDENMNKIKAFSKFMYDENRDKVSYLSKVLT